MSNQSELNSKDEFIEKIEQLSPEERDKALCVFKEKIHREYAAYLNSCVHCGLCADSCHYYLTDGDVKSMPVYKLGLVTKVFKKYFSFIGRKFPGWVGAAELTNEMIKEWAAAAPSTVPSALIFPI